MLVEYVTDFEDFKAAQRLARRHKPIAALSYNFWCWAVPGLALVAAAALIGNEVTKKPFLPAHIGGYLAGLVGAGAFLAMYRPYQMRKLYKTMKANRAAGEPVQFELTDTEIISRIPGRSEGRFLPNAVFDYTEDDRLALIYVAEQRFLIVPKSAMPEEDWVRLREWIKRGRT